MRVLLDECLPKRLKSEVEADKVKTVPEVGWASKKNGELQRLAQLDFDVLLSFNKLPEPLPTIGHSLLWGGCEFLLYL